MRFSQSYNLNAVTHAPEYIKSRNSDHRSWYRFFFAFEVKKKKKIPHYFPGRLLRAARDKQEEKVEEKKRTIAKRRGNAGKNEIRGYRKMITFRVLEK